VKSLKSHKQANAIANMAIFFGLGWKGKAFLSFRENALHRIGPVANKGPKT
jgi:hypothetical protein